LKGGLWFAHEAIVEREEIEPVEKAREKKPTIRSAIEEAVSRAARSLAGAGGRRVDPSQCREA